MTATLSIILSLYFIIQVSFCDTIDNTATPIVGNGQKHFCGNGNEKRWCYTMDIYPYREPTEFSLNIVNEDDDADTYFDITFITHKGQCAEPLISFEFVETDFDQQLIEYLDIHENNNFITRCTGSSQAKCETNIQCLDKHQLSVDTLEDGDTFKITIFEPHGVDALCGKYSIDSKLTLYCNLDDHWLYHRSLMDHDMDISSTFDGDAYFCGTLGVENRWCYTVDVYPSYKKSTQFSVNIFAADDNADTYFDITYISHCENCQNPSIDFVFEEIDFAENLYQYLDIFENDQFIQKCQESQDGNCGNFIQCLDKYDLSVDMIEEYNTLKITIFEPIGVDALCSDHNNNPYRINATVTLHCDVVDDVFNFSSTMDDIMSISSTMDNEMNEYCDNIEAVISCNKIQSGRMGTNEHRCFQFEINETYSSVTFSDYGSNFDTKLYVFNSYNEWVSEQYCDGDDCNPNSCYNQYQEIFTIPDLNANKTIYYIIIEPYDEGGNYILNIQCDDNETDDHSLYHRSLMASTDVFSTENPSKNPTKSPTKSPTTANPTTAQPTTANPTTAIPTTANPTTANPTTANPTTTQPTTANPTTFNPTTTSPTTAQPTTANPTTANPTTGNPTTANPTTANPTTANPTTATPTTAQPTTAQPTTASPTTAQPTTAQPTTAQPTTAQPTTAQPTTANPTTAQPTTANPTTANPTTANPTTANPTTANPTTANPTTANPTTANPTTANPTTDPTDDPTVDPTTDPTQNPTEDPAEDPTIGPTQNPTIYPSMNSIVDNTAAIPTTSYISTQTSDIAGLSANADESNIAPLILGIIGGTLCILSVIMLWVFIKRGKKETDANLVNTQQIEMQQQVNIKNNHDNVDNSNAVCDVQANTESKDESDDIEDNADIEAMYKVLPNDDKDTIKGETLFEKNQDNVDNWSIEDVVKWISTVRNEQFKQYADAFRINRIRGCDLQRIENKHLQIQFGIMSFADRLDIMEEINNLIGQKEGENDGGAQQEEPSLVEVEAQFSPTDII